MEHRGLSWDNVIALSYAAEQLFMAAQLLTSDTVPLERGIQRACRHLDNLVANRTFLPSYLVTWIRECVEQCRELHRSGGNGLSAGELSATVLQVLQEVHLILQDDESQSNRQAA